VYVFVCVCVCVFVCVEQWRAAFCAPGPNQDKRILAGHINNSLFFFKLCIINGDILVSVVPIFGQ
jgi:hypothetical protein